MGVNNSIGIIIVSSSRNTLDTKTTMDEDGMGNRVKIIHSRDGIMR
jgi:hypothetical protein